MQALRSDLKTSAKNLEKILLNCLQSFGWEKLLQSAQEKYLLSRQQVLILHQVALTLPRQPGHFLLINFLQAPQ